jgi:hypothetical protein
MNKDNLSGKETSCKITLIFALLAFLLSLYIALSALTPPQAKPDDAPVTEFSAHRAYQHLQVIAENVHNTGSANNETVKKYIMRTLQDIGLEPSVQSRRFSWVEHWGNLHVQNIICRINGTSSANSTIMLVAHYDTMPTGPGAMDDGSGVVTLIETARALQAGEPLKNDVILLFTDGEEPGLLGAQAFVEDNRELADEVDLIVNFDAGGTDGPAVLTETSAGNSYMVQRLLNSISEKTAFSSLVDLSKFFPSDTDIRVFEKTGIRYMNIIVSMHKERIHTPEDNVENFSINTLQQQGNYALGICRGFGNLSDLSSEINSSRDSVFFPVSNWFTVAYDQNWGVFLSVLAAVIYIYITFAGLQSKRLSLKNTLMGLTVFLTGIVSAGAISFTVISLARLAFKSRIDRFFNYELFPRGSEYANILIVGLVVFAFSIMSFASYRFMKKKPFIDLLTGAMLVWCIGAVVTALYLPGLGYMFVWPFIFALFIQGYYVFFNKSKYERIVHIISTFLMIVPPFTLFFPVAYISSSIGLDKVPLIIMMTALPFGIIAPYLLDRLGKYNRLVHICTGIIGIVLSLSGIAGFAIWYKGILY